MSAKATRCLADVRAALAKGDVSAANAHWCLLAMLTPDHALTWRTKGDVMSASGDIESAIDAWTHALPMTPHDAELRVQLARALAAANRHDDAHALLRTLPEVASAQAWITVGIELDRQGLPDEAIEAANRALQIDEMQLQARLLRARCRQVVGQSAGAAADYRQIIQSEPRHAAAWFGLLDLKTEAISSAELNALRAAQAKETAPEDRLLLAFALAKAEEAAGKLEQAVDLFLTGNQLARASRTWNAVRFRTECQAIAEAFEGLTPMTTDELASDVEVIFVTGLPRSGTTLVEHVLAAHPRVYGAGELPLLQEVIAAETHRRAQPFARWASNASEADWTRLGQKYLLGVATRRGDNQVVTDKMPGNWLYAGAALRMLPQARFVHCMRDPVETAWSCYQQLFAKGGADYSFDFDDLACCWADSQRLSAQWERLSPSRFYRLSYEQLVERPEKEIRTLLSACGLTFDEKCLSPHTASRNIHTPSASQVRQPIRSNTARTHLYGALLNDLREAIDRQKGWLVGGSERPT